MSNKWIYTPQHRKDIECSSCNFDSKKEAEALGAYVLCLPCDILQLNHPTATKRCMYYTVFYQYHHVRELYRRSKKLSTLWRYWTMLGLYSHPEWFRHTH